MGGRNTCKCPPPSGTTISCAEDEAATCYTDEHGEVHGACYPMATMLALVESGWDQMRRRMGRVFAHQFGISDAKLATARWVSQTLQDNSTVVSVHFQDGSAINLKFPPGVLSSTPLDEMPSSSAIRESIKA